MKASRPSDESQPSDDVPPSLHRSVHRRRASGNLARRVRPALSAVGGFAGISVFVALSAYAEAPEEGLIPFLVTVPFVLGAMLGIWKVFEALARRRRRRRPGRAGKRQVPATVKPIEVQLARSPFQRRGRLVITETSVEIHYPKWPEPLILPVEQVILVDPDVATQDRGHGTDTGLGADTLPAVFPRVQLVQIDPQYPANLLLVPHQPLPVPRTRRARWCDVIAVAVSTWPTEYQLQSTRLLRLPSLDAALAHLYGTISGPRLSPADMQLGWQVRGVALDRPGTYSRDPRPVARLSDLAVGDRSAASRRARRTWLAAGFAAAVIGAAAFAALVEWAPDYVAVAIFVQASMMSLVVRWTRHRTTPSVSRAAGAVTALLTFVSLSVGMALASVADQAATEGVALSSAVGDFGNIVGWDRLPGIWYAAWQNYLVVAVALLTAYGVGASGLTGRARRFRSTARTGVGRLLPVGVGLLVLVVIVGLIMVGNRWNQNAPKQLWRNQYRPNYAAYDRAMPGRLRIEFMSHIVDLAAFARSTHKMGDAYCEAIFDDREQDFVTDFYDRLHAEYPDMSGDHMMTLLNGVQVGAKADLCP
jgi:hypothetical protein